MSVRLSETELALRQELAAAPPIQRVCDDRTFELPPVLHVTTSLLFIGFVSVLSLSFAHPEMAVPWAIFVLFIAAFLIVPALWTRIAPANQSKALSWSQLMERGVDTATGHTSGREAAILVLMLPVFIFAWAIAVSIINALV